MQVETTEIDGLAIRFGRTSTEQPHRPLLLFNGIGASLELITPFAEAMQREDFTCVIFDVPGVGGSATPMLPYRLSRLSRLADHLLAHIGIAGPVDVLGVSWGARWRSNSLTSIRRAAAGWCSRRLRPAP